MWSKGDQIISQNPAPLVLHGSWKDLSVTVFPDAPMIPAFGHATAGPQVSTDVLTVVAGFELDLIGGFANGDISASVSSLAQVNIQFFQATLSDFSDEVANGQFAQGSGDSPFWVSFASLNAEITRYFRAKISSQIPGIAGTLAKISITVRT